MPTLHARTVEISDPGDLTSLIPEAGTEAATTTAVWIRRGDGMVGLGEVARYEASPDDPDPIRSADRWWTEFGSAMSVTSLDGVAGSGPVAFGTFCFDPANTATVGTLVVPEIVIGRRNGRCWVTLVTDDPAANPSAELVPNPHAESPAPASIRWSDGSMNGPEWEVVVADAVERIRSGVVDKIVLARDVIAETGEPIDLAGLVRRLSHGYERCWSYHVDGLVGATPEMLVRRERSLATSRVLAGTIRRTGSDDQDLALAAALSQSSKDLSEHEFAVRSVADALAPYCSGMHVPDSPYVLELPNVLHLATDVTAVATDHSSALSLAAALHPSAAVCGTPTDKARSLIADLEQMDRGRYAGPVGWVDTHGDGEWGIGLRCGQLADDRRSIRLYAGCGIVADSDPTAELAESNAKLVPMRDALTG
ncbi:MAG TPA: isochorismate synthase [Candidatus Avipropionibacterium avicola]|uniref:isochorismate synthase n=1 Tax=Candidatus Avipropionibacterium avicola TaxID=2840701 RepID=A0A9D1KMD2_9ACTN|nr:isochorismate synthase [Candidatus Avipropionibacterium avicola]